MTDRAQIAAARTDLSAFARLLGVPLAAHQADALRLQQSVTVVVAHRQAGKSDAAALLALQRAFSRPGVRVLVISAGEEAAKRLLYRVRTLAAGHPLLSVNVVDDTAGLVRLSNGSEIRSVPPSHAQVRGWSVDLLIIDEAAMVDDDLILSAAFPTTLAREGARILLLSSPMGRAGVFFDHARRGWSADVDVQTFRWRIGDATWIGAEALTAMRSGMPDLRARAELDGEFVDLTGGHRLIPEELIDAAVARSLRPTDEGVVSVDVARFGGDRTVAYVNRGGVVRKLLEGRGWDTGVTAANVAGAMREQLHSPPQPYVLIVDDTGVGGGVTDQARRLLRSVVGFVGAERAVRPERFMNRRSEVFWWMREAFEQGLVDLDPEDRDVVGQLGDLVYEYDPKARVRMESKDHMRGRGVRSPDHADAVCMSFARAEWRAPVEWAMSPEDVRARRIAEIVARHERAVEFAASPEGRMRAAFGVRGHLSDDDLMGMPL